jgi:hypothetical protein
MPTGQEAALLCSHDPVVPDVHHLVVHTVSMLPELRFELSSRVDDLEEDADLPFAPIFNLFHRRVFTLYHLQSTSQR